MSGKEDDPRNLTEFEAALASLRPRADKLDPGLRSLLAKEASANAECLVGKAEVPKCEPASHQFVCIHCGKEMPAARRAAHWTWPAATASVASVAAVLLLMVAVGREPRSTVRDTRTDVAAKRPAAATEIVPGRFAPKETRFPEPWILTAADVARYDKLPEPNAFVESSDDVSNADAGSPMSRSTSAALLRQLLEEQRSGGPPARLRNSRDS